jgi:hypothetical protein
MPTTTAAPPISAPVRPDNRPAPDLAPVSRQERTNHARRWWILAILAIAQLMVVLDSTVVNIALPSAQRALGFNDNGSS